MGGNDDVYRRRDVGTLYVVVVDDVAVFLYLQLFAGNSTFEGYAAQAVGGVYVAVVEGCLYGGDAVVY